MDINLRSFISIDTLKEDPESVFSIIDRLGQAVIFKDNKPSYVIRAISDNEETLSTRPASKKNYKLHEAMKIVLEDAKDHTMHASQLADEIYRRKLYFKKDGTKAEAIQIRARCNNYSNLFKAEKGNNIRLLTEAEDHE